MATRMQQRRGTASQWTTANPVLATGEIGFETDTNQFKMGDGTNHWADLSYFKNLDDLGGSLDDYVLIADLGAPGSAASLDVNGYIPVNQLGNILGEAPQILDTLEELAGALQDADGLVTIKINTKADEERIITTADIDTAVTTAVTQARADVTTEIGNAVSEEVLGRNNAIADAVADEVTARNNAISNAVNDEATARNNAITAAIADEVVDRDNAILGSANDVIGQLEPYADNAASAAQTAAETSAQGYVDTHNTDTTNVHGISDTSALATKTYADDAVSTHNSDTTSVHGIADTSVLATDTDIQDAKDYADSQIDTHVAVTTNVHGISDTSKIVLTDAVSTTLDGALVITGDLTVNGTNFSASATSITIEDNLVQLAHQNAANTVDLGLVVGYNDGAAKHSGIVRDVSADTWKLFKGVTTEPSTTVDFTEGSLDNLAVNNITAAGVVFTDGTQTKQGVPSITDVAAVTTTNGAFNTSPLNRDMLVEYTESVPGTLTILPDSQKDFPVGSSFDILQVGTGQLTIVADSGVTVNATPGLKLRTQWSSATLFKRAANTWVVFGDLSA